jgi:hypothetical protein
MEIVLSILFVIAMIVTIYVLCVWLMFSSVSRSYSSEIKDLELTQKKCPKCQDVRYERIYRKWWMHIIIGTKYYRCNICRSKFMIIFWGSAIEIS